MKLSTYRPSDYQHVYFAVQSYLDSGGEPKNSWELLPEGIHKDEKEGYFGVAYINKEQKHIIIAHRGTDFGLDSKSLTADFDVMTRYITNQEAIAWDFTKQIIERYKYDYTYSFTGHSLGGWLAQACLWKYEDKFKLQDYNDSFAVTLDEPGAKEMLEALQPGVANDYRVDVNKLDITNYLSCPNLINIIMSHVGTVYVLDPELNQSFLTKYTPKYTQQAHGSNLLLKEFSETTGLPTKSMQVLDWPRVMWKTKAESSDKTKSNWRYFLHMAWAYVKGDIKKGEYDGFFNYSAEQIKNPETLDSISEFNLRHGIHYNAQPFNPLALPLRNMPSGVRQFLEELSVQTNRAEYIQNILAKTIDEEIATLLNAYSVNPHFEIVVDQTKINIDARMFVHKIREFLSLNPKLYNTKLAVLTTENIRDDIQKIKTGQTQQTQESMLQTLMIRLDTQTQSTSKLLEDLIFRQGTARLYKYSKPSFNELQQIENEYNALGDELKYIEHSELVLKFSSLNSELINALQAKLEEQRQQLLIAKQTTNSLLLYMKGNIDAADKETNDLISLLNAGVKMSNLDTKLLLNRAYNLKAKIAAIRPEPEATQLAPTHYKELAAKYYSAAVDFFPNDVITKNNYIGLLTDRARSEQNSEFQLKAYDYYREIAPSLEQIPNEQRPIAYSGLAYSLIMLSRYLEQGKIDKAQFIGLPNVDILRKNAQILLEKAKTAEIGVNGNYINTRLFLSILAYDQQKYEPALQEIENALTLNPEHELSLMQKGLILESMGFNQEALEYLNIAKNRLEKRQDKIDSSSWIKEIDEALARIANLNVIQVATASAQGANDNNNKRDRDEFNKDNNQSQTSSDSNGSSDTEIIPALNPPTFASVSSILNTEHGDAGYQAQTHKNRNKNIQSSSHNISSSTTSMYYSFSRGCKNIGRMAQNAATPLFYAYKNTNNIKQGLYTVATNRVVVNALEQLANTCSLDGTIRMRQ